MTAGGTVGDSSIDDTPAVGRGVKFLESVEYDATSTWRLGVPPAEKDRPIVHQCHCRGETRTWHLTTLINLGPAAVGTVPFPHIVRDMSLDVAIRVNLFDVSAPNTWPVANI
eukprot:CAMPEP_0178598624 /NCGR_PEP_ID=MMETSP0697-20121206/32849_1 /TAXON_ID=265572 /ORGANISM="Extubocellulus spinifer, Strain CCMP396" /LENGTH=111 /DNA_ID=CAMNT_0020236419 /DNA_START=129 /DNA_END=464 /DNA_ORIENTATION=+